MCTRSAHAAVSKVSADAVLKKVLNVRRKKAGEFLKDVRAINAIKLEDSHLLEGVRYHTAGSEPFFYDASYNHTRQLGAIPVDLNGRCVVAEEIGDRHLIRMRPLKWKCTNECRLLTSGEMKAVLGTNTAPQHLVCRAVQSLHINHMQMSIIEVFICRRLHMNTSMILICIWLICRLCTALHTKCCGAVKVAISKKHGGSQSWP